MPNRVWSSLLGCLCHQIQRASSLEPADLALVEGVSEGDLLFAAVLVVKDHADDRAWCQLLDVEEVDMVRWLDAVVVGGVLKVERQHALLLQVGLVDTSERTSDDGGSTEEAGLESGVLARRSLAVVLRARASCQRVFCTSSVAQQLTSSPTTTHGIPESRYCAATAGTPAHSPVFKFWILLASPFAALMAPIKQFCE